MSVCIVSYMGSSMPDSETAADILATFFLQDRVFDKVENGKNVWLPVNVHSYICLPHVASYNMQRQKFDDNIVVTLTDQYKKTMICDTKHLPINGNQTSDVLILLGHGSSGYYRKGERRQEISSVVFGEGDKPLPSNMRIWSCKHWMSGNGFTHRAPPEGITLDVIVGDSKLLILQSCFGKMIMQQYLQTAANMHDHEILVFEDEDVKDYSSYILIAWLIIEMESDENRKGTLVERVRRSIMNILTIVRECTDKGENEDSEALWQDLLSSGCVLEMHPRCPTAQTKIFTIEGTICRFDFNETDTRKLILNDFKKLTLITCGPSLDETQRISFSNVIQHADSRQPSSLAGTVLLLDQMKNIYMTQTKAAWEHHLLT
jgi:hypothetical protein